ncbi:MAG: putative metal-binding motif-containing protein [Myxococcota bacterium]
MVRNSVGWSHRPLRVRVGYSSWLTLFLSGSVWALSGCEPEVARDNPWDLAAEGVVDADGDRYPATEDCDDDNPEIHPDQSELCNTLDDNCDGTTDEGLPTATYYQDNDDDNFGSSVTLTACGGEPPAGYASRAGDCNDKNADINPNAEDFCDGKDQNCNDEVDEDADSITYYEDRDKDKFGDPAQPQEACDPAEADNEGWVENNRDCDDDDDQIYPGAPETCNGIDEDCDGLPDAQDPNATPKQTLYPDADGDDYGDKDASPIQACPQEGYVAVSGDCDDQDDTVYPFAPELCDDLDNDCNGKVDEGLNKITYYLDADDDGYGLTTSTADDCAAPDGYSAFPGDCDDTRITVNPDAPELCDGLDNDCDKEVDEGLSPLKYYPDADGDGYGDRAFASAPTEFCGPVEGYSPNAQDCNDGAADINPAANERFNIKDDNCDGLIDYQIPSVEEAELILEPEGLALGARPVAVSFSEQIGVLASLGSTAEPSGAVLWRIDVAGKSLSDTQEATFDLGVSGVGTQVTFARMRSPQLDDVVLTAYDADTGTSSVQVYLNDGTHFVAAGALSHKANAVLYESEELTAPLDGVATLDMDGDGIQELALACARCQNSQGDTGAQGLVLVLSLTKDTSTNPVSYGWKERVRIEGHDVGFRVGEAVAGNEGALLALTLAVDDVSAQEVRVFNLARQSGLLTTKSESLLYTLTTDSTGVSSALKLTSIGLKLAFADDINQNLEPELVLSATTFDGSNAVGVVDIHSSYAKAGLYVAGAVMVGTTQSVSLGEQVAVTSDLTGDGISDLLLTSQRSVAGQRYLDTHLLSGAAIPDADNVRDVVSEQLASFTVPDLTNEPATIITGFSLSSVKSGLMLCTPGYEDSSGPGFVGLHPSPYLQ